MKPQSPGQDDLLLFQAHFDQLLDPAHPLLKLAGQIDWAAFDDAFGELYCQDNGAPAKATRLMVGLHYLKHTFNESDAPGNGRGQVGGELDSGGGRRSAATATCGTSCRSIPPV